MFPTAVFSLPRSCLFICSLSPLSLFSFFFLLFCSLSPSHYTGFGLWVLFNYPGIFGQFHTNDCVFNMLLLTHRTEERKENMVRIKINVFFNLSEVEGASKKTDRKEELTWFRFSKFDKFRPLNELTHVAPRTVPCKLQALKNVNFIVFIITISIS